MPNRETQKFVLGLSMCLAVALVAVAFMFSTFFESHGKVTQSSSSPCQDKAPFAISAVEDELAPLDPSQEEVLVQGDTGLAPAEVLDLNETVDEMKNITATQTVTLEWKPVAKAKGYHVQAWQMTTDDKKLMLIDADVDQTTARVERKTDGEIFWQVAAVDSAGRIGEYARGRKPASTH